MENHIHRGPDGLHPLQTEWILALCNSVLAPAPAAPPTTHPNMAPRMQTDPAIGGEGTPSPQAEAGMVAGAPGLLATYGEDGLREERAAEEGVSASGVFPKDFLEERAPRSQGSTQRAETLGILSQRGHGDQGVWGEEDVGLLLDELWEVEAGEAGGAKGGVGEGSSPWLFPGPALADPAGYQ